ncbi:bifunctional nuclease family protein [Pseudogemmatithrix spongiicola]|uniref:Bifunctional nuclease family protein n=1 Tax=Pseudogemmatithrix spongiicola TaxID=3062599 RepID=A0AA49Q4L8_9BACT|nr:bifunctional nuclease family protein [Gemmatimonadaceae bacterium 'strain 138']WKW14967.1 bifunctional nuclease family protein [Gemmatimonadaceae bacterium 'strain 318']
MIEVNVQRIGLDAQSQAFVVILEERAGDRALPIWIGRPEAEAIAAHLNDVKRERPMTHDLAASLITGLGGLLRRVQITRVVQGTFHAELHLNRHGSNIVVDARPSDAIAIALRAGAPIFVAEALFDGDDDADADAPADGDHLSVEELQRHLSHLRPEDFGRFTP